MYEDKDDEVRRLRCEAVKAVSKYLYATTGAHAEVTCDLLQSATLFCKRMAAHIRAGRAALDALTDM